MGEMTGGCDAFLWPATDGGRMPAAGPDSGFRRAAIGLPVCEDGVFPGKQGDAIARTDRGVGGGGPVVDHGELDLLDTDVEGGQDIGEATGACQRVVKTAAGRNRDGAAQ